MKNLKTFNECMRACNEGFLPFNKSFSELKEGDKIYMWVNDSSNDDASKEIVNVYTFENMQVPDDRKSMDPWSKIKLNTYEEDISIYNKDYNANVSFENRNAATWWCVSTNFEALKQTLNDVFHLSISEANLDVNQKPENTVIANVWTEFDISSTEAELNKVVSDINNAHGDNFVITGKVIKDYANDKLMFQIKVDGSEKDLDEVLADLLNHFEIINVWDYTIVK